MLRIRSLTKSFAGPPPRRVLNDVSLALAPGEYVAVMGESGVGKSTLLNLIAGLDKPDAGSIEFDGVALDTLSDDALAYMRRDRMGFVFQAFHVLPYLNLEQNVSLPLRLAHIAAGEARARAVRMLEQVGLGARTHSMPGELSGGELQRVAISRALVHRPHLVLADEPTGNLDPSTADQVLTLLQGQIRQTSAAGIIVTHSDHAASTADRVLVLTPDGLSPR